MKSKLDLHMHSTASDGTDTPEELLEQIKQVGIRIFSLTDHDAIDGCAQMEAITPEGITFVPGVEFSCITGAGKCHILGYGYRPDASSMARALEAGRTLRLAKLTRRLEHLESVHAIRFSQAELDWLYSLHSPGKPHLAELIVKQGRAATGAEAIRAYIDGCKGGDDRIDAAIAIEGILGAGGIPVWAHPLGGEGEKHLSRETFAAQLGVLTGLGIQGLECHYSRYTAEEVAFLREQAATHGLLISGGSDYHGTAKDIPLGTLNAYGQEVTEKALTILNRLTD
ncbi:MAG: PHP domain-containing protein [Bacillota bacterium]|nr:PHP domain-containing protein [Bacillota bacterium]